jgi:hypothetical protein
MVNYFIVVFKAYGIERISIRAVFSGEEENYVSFSPLGFSPVREIKNKDVKYFHCMT